MRLSVVIPTRDRRAALEETLAAFASQRVEGEWEVVVVDNGSSDDTIARAEEAAASFPVPLRVLREPRPGPAAARNSGARAAGGELILYTGDDTAPADDRFVASHIELHAARPEETYLVLGRATWRTDKPVTELMEWLEHGGTQFQYDRLQPGPVPVERYFYTPNVSLKRALWERTGGFDERFPFAAIEDTEYGLRLAAAGAVLDYHPEIVVLHDHPTPLDASLRRMVKVGQSAALFHQLHPGVAGPGLPARPAGAKWRLIGLLAGPAAALDRPRVPLAVRRRGWELRHMAAYADGVALGPPSAA